MPKSLVNIHELVESDFREIQKIFSKKFGKEYTVGYIRKVCKSRRNNTNIIAIAEEYLSVKREMKEKIDKLSN